MKQLIVFIILILMIPTVSCAQKKVNSFSSWENYEVTTIRVGVEGSKFIKVWGVGKNIDKAIISAKQNAVHACIFKGLPGCANANSTPAILRDASVVYSHEDYFSDFFAPDGDYFDYLNVITDGTPNGMDRIKVKGGYKVAIYVQVMYDSLKKRLEDDGIVKKLNHGF